MSSPTIIELKNIDSEDIGDVLQKVEKSFVFQFNDTELKGVKTFGELCDVIINKVEGDSSDDCTTQQAFYKLRKAIAITLDVNKSILKVNTRLEELLPRKQRTKQIKAVENLLGFQIKLLRPKHWITTSFAFLLIASFIGLPFYWQVGIAGLVFSFVALWVSDKLGKELTLTTFGELAEQIAREHYKHIRRNPTTMNRVEVIQKVKELFMTGLNLEESVLTREATFR